jgi:hypothetical protein
MAKFDRDGSIIRSNSELSKSEHIHSPVPLVAQMSQAAKTAPVRNGLFARLFPNAQERAIAEGKLEMVKTDYEFLKKALILSRETQIASLQETCEHYIIRQRVEVRQQIATHILSEQQKLQDNLDSITEDFVTSMVKKMKEAENIDLEFLRNIRRGQLEADAVEFANLQQSLLERFRRSLPDSI